MIQIKHLPPRWHIIGKDGICCDGNCKKNKNNTISSSSNDSNSIRSSNGVNEFYNNDSTSSNGGSIRSSINSSCGSDDENDDMKGPLDISNWVVKNKIMTGEYPGNEDDETHLTNLSVLLDSGITTFVCLQEVHELTKFRDYKQDVINLAKQRQLSSEQIEFLHFPIEDGGIAPSLDSLAEFLEILLQRLQDNKKIYLHCWAGRGRTGIIASCLLGRIYKVSGLEALRRTQACYEQRIIGVGESPEYHPQRMQVIRYLKYIDEKQSQPKEFSLSSSS